MDTEIPGVTEGATEEAEPISKDPGTPLEAEENGSNNEPEEGEDDSSDDDDGVQIHIGDIKSNVQFRPVGNAAQKGVKTGGPTGKLDVDATAEINGTPIYDLDLANMEEKPWRKPGSDITDYFNYGFTEETWNMYCERQRKLRSEYGPLANKQLFSSIVIGSSSLARGNPIISTNQSGGNLITNLADKSPQMTPIFRKILTPGGRMEDITPQTIPTVNLAAPKVSAKVSSSIPVIGGSGTGGGMTQQPPAMQTPTVLVTTTPAVPNPTVQPNLLNMDPMSSFEENEGPPGESPRPGTATPPPGVEPSSAPATTASEPPISAGGNFTTGVPTQSQPQTIQSLGVVNMSVPPPGFSGADISVPPPRFNVPPPFNLPPRPMPPGMHHPTNVPPPGMGPPGFNPPPPGIMMPNMGRGGPGAFPYRPMGPRPPGNVIRAYAGFQPPPQDGERSPASYSDQSSDMEDRDHHDRDRRMGSRSRRPEHSYRSRRGSRSPPGYDRRRRGRDDYRSGRYERSPEKERERSTRSSRRRGSPEKEEERKREEKSSSSKKRSSSTTKNLNDSHDEDEGKERRRKRKRKDEDPSEEGSSRGSKKVKEEPRDEGEREKEKEPRKSKKSSKEKKSDS